MEWLLALSNISSLLMIIGAVAMFISGIVVLFKKYPDEETAHKMKKSGIAYIMAGLLFIVAAFVFGL
ncbi:MAG: hypothetical protein IJ680_02385 [Paludibacteraceae bacterium]|nr:hypothetical protein [Paludibacteraceae bacterium]